MIEELLQKEPDDAAMKKDLAEIQATQKAVEKKGLSKFKGTQFFCMIFVATLMCVTLGMYNRPAKEGQETEKKDEEIEEIRSPGVAGSS